MKNWSFSKLSKYEICPHSLSFPYEVFTPCAAAQRGIDIHTKCEEYILHGGEEPVEDFGWETLQGAIPEMKLGLDKNWEPCPYNEAWLKVIIDAYLPGKIIDFKTGKREYNDIKHMMQMQLYACAVMSSNEEITIIETELWYLDIPTVISKSYTREKLIPLRERINNRAVKMMNDTKLNPTPSKSACKFCNYNQKCEFAHESIEKK